ncbi:class 1b ribonucleoside-diphosphate reductase subunit alpha [Vaginisenegalia massiliensis]|uniref:class 1b ribonucleoside-diphosphate reductase subunit alpha n=1 Tax=Vaginisenegalia massiliensis TaxID=2058294 RepID=UPI000F539572|nr:class 1b ribonucleoside-diphosphate reductase subunit alpha [Vaginisenegalia massiliensis]
MDKPVLSSKPTEITYYKLNNELNRPVDGKIPLHKDREAVRAYFLEHVNPNTVFFYTLDEKIKYLMDHDYIEREFIEKYDRQFVKDLISSTYDMKFRFKSFMSAYKFYTQYALKTNDGQRYIERYEDRIAFCALFLADGDEALATKLRDEMIAQRYQPATPTFLNAGRKRRGELVSCFLIQVTDDMNSIGRTINSALQLSRIGGGVGVNLSNLRAAGDPIKKIENASSGVVPVMKLLEDSFSYSNQLGQRNGAGAVYLNIFHPDVVSFLSTKKENADEKIRVKTLSLGLVVPDKFYELAAKDEPMYLFSPYDVERIYGKPFSYIDITAEYDNLVNNEEIRKSKVFARDLENEISKLQQESGYPYIINIDTANRANPIEGTITMSNLCSEILQIQRPSVINNRQEFEVLGTDISCNLGSTNIVNMIQSPDFASSVETAVRALTYVTDHSNIEAVPTVKHGNDLAHTIGLGAMGLHTLFAINQMEYGSPESLELTEAYFNALNYYSLVASNKIAKERQHTFENFEASKYATGEYFDTFIQDPFTISSPKVAEIMTKVPMPTAEDWQALKEAVQADGLYHQNRLAIAPTGSISYVNETSASLHPITRLIEERQEKKTGKTYYPAPMLSNDTLPYYKSAYDMDMRKVIDVYAAAQKYIDQGMSLTLFMRSEIPEGMYEWKQGRTNKMTTRDLNILRHYAWKKGIKSIYYVRTFTENNDEVGSNECESCSI